VRFGIPQSELDALREEHRRDVHVFVNPDPSDSTWSEGRLAFVDNEVDAGSGTLLLKGEFTNADGTLWPGAFTRVRLRLHEQAGAIVVPSAAVSSSQSGPYCYVVAADTTVEMRPVTVTRTWGALSVIGSGLKPGETVVTDGQVRLTPGARASIRVPQPPAGRGGPSGAVRAAAGRRP
jgi:multidrug efflux system membrane fusion protein